MTPWLYLVLAVVSQEAMGRLVGPPKLGTEKYTVTVTVNSKPELHVLELQVKRCIEDTLKRGVLIEGPREYILSNGKVKKPLKYKQRAELRCISEISSKVTNGTVKVIVERRP